MTSYDIVRFLVSLFAALAQSVAAPSRSCVLSPFSLLLPPSAVAFGLNHVVAKLSAPLLARSVSLFFLIRWTCAVASCRLLDRAFENGLFDPIFHSIGHDWLFAANFLQRHFTPIGI